MKNYLQYFPFLLARMTMQLNKYLLLCFFKQEVVDLGLVSIIHLRTQEPKHQLTW